MPHDVKSKLALEDPRSNRGYVQQGRERVTQATDAAEIAAMREKAPDCKESMEIGRDWDATWRNMWPKDDDCPGFKGTMLDFFKVSLVVLLWGVVGSLTCLRVGRPVTNFMFPSLVLLPSAWA